MQTVRSKDGTTIAFEKYGDGQPVILVGGALSDRKAGTPLAALLSANFTVFAYDRRGRGASGDTSPYAVEREIEDLNALIMEAGGTANVFGLSSGAVLAFEAASRGLAIKKLALFEPPFFSVVDSRRRKSFAPHVNELITSGRRGDALEFFMTKVVEIPSEVVAQIRNAPMWPFLEGLAHTLVYDLTIVGDGSLPAERIATNAPALLIVGGKSPAWMRQAGEAVVDALPHGQVRVLEGQDHAAGPEALAPVLQKFFDG